MSMSGKRMSRLSRVKATVGALAATLALAGVVQAAIPVAASAQKPLSTQYCMDIYSKIVQVEDLQKRDQDISYETLYVYLLVQYINGNCDGAINGS